MIEMEKDAETHNIISKMPCIQWKFIHHSSNQENNNLNEKRQSTDANVKINQLLKLSDKDYKTDIQMLHK